MSYKYHEGVTKDSLEKGIILIANTKKEQDTAIKKYGIAAVEYAIINQDSSFVRKLLKALDGRQSNILISWFTMPGVPLVKDRDFGISFSLKKLNLITGKDLTQEALQNKTGNVETVLEIAATAANAALKSIAWDAFKPKAAEKTDEEKAIAKDKARKRAMEKYGLVEPSAKVYNIQSSSAAPATKLPAELVSLLESLPEEYWVIIQERAEYLLTVANTNKAVNA